LQLRYKSALLPDVFRAWKVLSEKISHGDHVMLYLDKRRKWLVKVEEGKVFHTHKGVVDISSLIGMEYGCEIKTSMGVSFLAVKPSLIDHIYKIVRKTQIIYPKDMALMLMLGNVGPGCRVVEAGTGSGALTSFLAYHVRPDGRVYSYEIREEFLKQAAKNIKKLGLDGYVELKLKDITAGIDESDVDCVMLDMPTPWLVAEHAHRALRHGGFMVCFNPTINQVEKLVEAMEKAGFVDVSVIEAIVREYKVRSGETRPQTLMIGHTGYITAARKP